MSSNSIVVTDSVFIKYKKETIKKVKIINYTNTRMVYSVRQMETYKENYI